MLRRNLNTSERCNARRFKVQCLRACRWAILLIFAFALGSFFHANRQALPKIVDAARDTGSWNLTQLLAAPFAASIQHIDHVSLVYIGSVLLVLLSGYLLATLGWHVWLHWSLPRIYEDQILESTVLWRWLGCLTMVFFSVGGCLLVISSFGGKLDLVSESVSFATAVGSFFGYFLVIMPVLTILLSLGLGTLVLKRLGRR